MLESSEQVAEFTQESSGKLDEFKESLAQLVRNANTIKSDNETIGHGLFMNISKLDHMIFKFGAYSSAFENKVPKDIIDHHNCNFGKWYQSEGKQAFGNHNSFSKIDQPHKKVHDYVAQVLKIIGKEDALMHADEIVKLFALTEQESDLFFNLLNDLA